MKKILSILTITGLTITTAATVVACGSNSSNEHKRYDNLKPDNNDEVILKFGDSALEVGDLSGLTGDSAKNLILDWINTKSTTRYSQDVLNSTNTSRLKLTDENINNLITNATSSLDPSKVDNSTNYYYQEFNTIANNLTLESLFTNYTKAVSTDGTKTLDDQKQYYFGGLNPNSYLDTDGGTRDNSGRESALSIWFTDPSDSSKLIRWVAKHEVPRVGTYSKSLDLRNSLTNKEFSPTGQSLTTSEFYIVKDQTLLSDANLVATDLTSSKTSLGANILNTTPLSGREALALRFENYIANQSPETEKIMAMQYLKGDLYKMRTNNGNLSGGLGDQTLENLTKTSLFLNRDSLLAKDVQTWTSNGRASYTPTYKMVWAFSFKKDDTIITKVNNLLNSAYNASTANSDDVLNLNTITSDTTLNSFTTALATLVSTVGNANLNTSGLDPFFNQGGFQGIVKSSGGTVTSVLGGNLNINDSTKAKLANVNGPSFLINKLVGNNSTKYDFTFQSTTDVNNQVDVVLALPIYLQDLLGDIATTTTTNSTSNTLNNLALNTWVELNPQDSSDTWTSSATITGGSFSEYTPTTQVPVGPSYYYLNKKTYVYVPSSAQSNDLTLTLSSGETISFNWSDNNQENYLGIQGVYNNAKTTLNGQNVAYKLHLGNDTTNPDVLETDWKTNFTQQQTLDILNLSTTAKQALLDDLLYLTADSDSQAIENAKNGIYKRYINPNDIWYQPIYDALIGYIKVNDEDEDSD